MLAEHVGEPRDDRDRVAECGGAVPARHHLAVAAERDTESSVVGAGRGLRPGAQHGRPVGGEIGDRVGQADAPVHDPGVDDLQPGRDLTDRAARLLDADAGPGQRRRQPEHDLRLHLGRDEPAAVEDGAVRVEGGAEHRGEVGGVDPEHLLHRSRGEPRLVADDAVAVGQQQRRQLPLDGVALGRAQGRVVVGERGDRLLRRAGLVQDLGAAARVGRDHRLAMIRRLPGIGSGVSVTSPNPARVNAARHSVSVGRFTSMDAACR